MRLWGTTGVWGIICIMKPKVSNSHLSMRGFHIQAGVGRERLAMVGESAGNVFAGGSSSSHAEHPGEQCSSDDVFVALSMVVITVVGFPVHSVIVVHSDEVSDLILVLVPEIEVTSWTF